MGLPGRQRRPELLRDVTHGGGGLWKIRRLPGRPDVAEYKQPRVACVAPNRYPAQINKLI